MMIKNRKEETVNCTCCGKELKGNDIVYYLESDEDTPYCSTECIVNDLHVGELLAKNWYEV